MTKVVENHMVQVENTKTIDWGLKFYQAIVEVHQVVVEIHQVMVEIHQVIIDIYLAIVEILQAMVDIHRLKFMCYDFTAISDFLQMAAANTSTTNNRISSSSKGAIKCISPERWNGDCQGHWR